MEIERGRKCFIVLFTLYFKTETSWNDQGDAGGCKFVKSDWTSGPGYSISKLLNTRALTNYGDDDDEKVAYMLFLHLYL